MDGPLDQSFAQESIPSLVIPVTGTYTITVSALAGGSGDYALRLDALPTVTYGETLTGTVTEGNVSAMLFRGRSGDVVDIVVTEARDSLDAVVAVTDLNGNLLTRGEVDRTYAVETIRGLSISADGLYFIRVRGFAGSSGDFAVALTLVNSE